MSMLCDKWILDEEKKNTLNEMPKIHFKSTGRHEFAKILIGIFHNAVEILEFFYWIKLE